MKCEYYKCDICGAKMQRYWWGESDPIFTDYVLGFDLCIDCKNATNKIREKYEYKIQQIKEKYINEIKKRRKLEVEE